MEYLRRLADPHLTARFQRVFGVVPLQEYAANGIHPVSRDAVGSAGTHPNGGPPGLLPGVNGVCVGNGLQCRPAVSPGGKQVDHTFSRCPGEEGEAWTSPALRSCHQTAATDHQQDLSLPPHSNHRPLNAPSPPAPPPLPKERTCSEQGADVSDSGDCRSIRSDRSRFSSSVEDSGADSLERDRHPPTRHGTAGDDPESASVAADEEISQSPVTGVKSPHPRVEGGHERKGYPSSPDTGGAPSQGPVLDHWDSSSGLKRLAASGVQGKNGLVKIHPLEQRNGLKQRKGAIRVDANANPTPCHPTETAASDGKPAYLIQYRALYYLSLVGAFLGDEMFYLMFYPFCIWNMDSILARDTSLIWCVVMYLGQATKDYLRWPRPRSPPVVRLETAHLHEYSMPSTHAMAGTAMPIAMAFQLMSRYQVSSVVVVTAGCCYCALVCFSRLYLGVHSLLDIICGVLFSILISVVSLPYLQDFDLYQQQHPYAPFIVLLTGLVVCTVCYPSKDVHSAKGDAVQIVACSSGCILAIWFHYQMGISFESDLRPPYAIAAPTLDWLMLSLLRFVLGSALLAGVYVVMKTLSVRFFSYVYGLDKPNKAHPSVRTAYKFVTYLVLGFSIISIVPLFLRALGIARPGQFQEVRW